MVVCCIYSLRKRLRLVGWKVANRMHWKVTQGVTLHVLKTREGNYDKTQSFDGPIYETVHYMRDAIVTAGVA